MRCAFLVLALSACGDGGSGAPDGMSSEPTVETPHSGSRLKLAWYEFEDGFRTWAPATDIVDAELGLPCTQRSWADGVTRCTPELGSVYYLDSACTMAVAYGGSFAAEGGSAATGCAPSGPATLFRVEGNGMSVSALYAKSDTGCRSSFPPSPTGHVFVQPASQVPLSTLVTTHVESRGAGPVLVDTLVGDDGLIAPLALRDHRYNATCDLEALRLGIDVPCLPSAAPSFDGHTFTDSYCSIPAVQVGDGTCPGSTIATVNTFGCPLLYEIGAPTSEPAYGIYASCTERTEVVGPIAPLTDRVDALALHRAPEPDGHRQQPLIVANGTTRFRDPFVLYDSALDTECVLEQHVKDGEVAHCIPVQASDISYQSYSDSNCTMANQPLAKGVIENTCGERRKATYVGGYYSLYRIKGPHVGNAYEMFGATCDPVVRQLFDIDELPVSSVASAVKRRDP